MYLLRNLLFTSLFLTLACSKDPSFSSSTSSTNNAAISPPTWILGTWEQKINGIVNTGYKFTNNDLITIVQGSEISQKATIELYKNGGAKPKTSQDVTDNMYSITIDYGTGQSQNYTFNKKSSTVIVWSRTPTVDFVKK